MRRLLALIVTALLIGVLAMGTLGWAAPRTAQASSTITGRIVGVPQSTVITASQPASLLLQAGHRTILVLVTSQTSIVDRNYHTASLRDLRDGALVRISGAYNGAEIVASLIRDLSLQIVTLQVKGTLAAPPSGGILCLANALVTGVRGLARAQVVSTCSSNQLSIYLTTNTTFINRDSSPITLGDLATNNSLVITGSLINGQFTASLVKDLSLPALTISVKGTLAAPPGSGFLCLNAKVTGVSSAARAQVVSTCASNQLTIYLATNTTFVNRDSTPITLGDLAVNDSLLVTGSLINGQFTASLVKDLSLPTLTINVKGTLAAPPGNGFLCLNAKVTGVSSAARAQVVSTCLSNQLTIYLATNTTFINRDSSPITLSDLLTGDSLLVTGSLINGQFTASLVKDVSSPHGTTLSGVLVAAPAGTDLPVNLLLQVGNQTVLVHVTSQTQLVDHNSNSITVGNLNNGDMLQVTGNFNNGQFNATLVMDSSI